MMEKGEQPLKEIFSDKQEGTREENCEWDKNLTSPPFLGYVLEASERLIQNPCGKTVVLMSQKPTFSGLGSR